VAQDEAFDVFLSYSRADASNAQRLVQLLRSRGLKVFFDRDYLTPGQAWPTLLEKHLRACRAVAICLGPEGLGPWQQREQYVALDRQAQEDHFPVIPLLLPGAKGPPLGFLRLSTWIDLTAGVDDWPALNVVERAIRGQAPSPDDAGLPDARATVCPYRGLEPFREEDEHFFVGREAFVCTLLEKIGQRPLVGVVGASGSGKSSVVLAGLVPSLRQRADGRVWEIGVMRPGSHPLRQLAAVFLPPDTNLEEFDRIAVLKKRAEQLASGEITLADVIDATLERQPGTDRLLLVVDQWEELYTQARDLPIKGGQDAKDKLGDAQTKNGGISSECDTFVRILLESVRSEPRLSLVLTIRGDFYGRALQDRALGDQLQDAIVNISPMARSELRRAIVEPAEKVSLSFEAGLVDAILGDIGNEPGNLPLLEFLLKELWDRHSPDRRLTFSSYASTGGVKRAIATRAEEELKKLSPEQQAAARRFLIRLVTPGEGQEDTRARTAIPLRDERVREVINRFASARLLTTGRDPASGREMVEVGHEALIREWDTLKAWVNADREFLRTIERVKASMRAWYEESGNKDERLLPPGRPLEEARELLEREDKEIGDLRDFVQASIAKDEARQEEEQRSRDQQQHKELVLARRLAEEEAARADTAETLAQEQAARSKATKRTYAISSLFGFMLLIAVAALAVTQSRSLDQQARSFEQLSLAHEETAHRLKEAQIAQSHLLAQLSQRKTGSGDAAAGILLALEALPRDQSDRRPVVREAVAALMQASLSIRERAVLKHQNLVGAVAVSPDGRIAATASDDMSVRIWDPTSSQEPVVLKHHDLVSAIAFSPDGRFVATASFDATARVWDATSQQERAFNHDGVVRAVGFSPDGLALATGSDDRAARIWNVTTGEVRELRGHLDAVRAVAFSPDGKVLATASDDKTVRTWDVATGHERSLLPHQDSVRAVAYSPDGRKLATASEDRTARIWDETSGEGPILRHEGAKGEIRALAFSLDGGTLVTVTLDNTTRVWNVATGHEDVVFRQPDPIRAAALSSDGRTLITAFDKTARISDVMTGRERLLPHRGPVNTAAFSPDGRTLTTISDDRAVQVWDIATGRARVPIKHETSVSAIALTPDGRTLATALFDKSVQVWDVEAGRQGPVLRHENLIKSVVVSPDGHTLATTSLDNTTRIWDVVTGQKRAELTHRRPVTAAAFSPDGRTLVTASDDARTRIWDVATARERELAHRGVVKAAAFSPDGRTLATTSLDGTLRLWDVVTGQEGPARSHNDQIVAIAFSPDGLTLAAASDDKTARIWEIATGREYAVLKHQALISAVAFSPDGRMLATASDDKTARIWDVTTGQQCAVLTHRGSVDTVIFSPDGRTLAIAAGEAVRLVAVPPGDVWELIGYARGKLPIGRKEFSKNEREEAFLDPLPASY
jgi:WD40 repeat protein